MDQGLLDVVHHHNWGTRYLIDFLQRQPPATLNLTAVGVYGSVVETLTHLIDSDASYLARLAPGQGARFAIGDGPASLADLSLWADELKRRWQNALAAGWEIEGITTVTGDSDGEFWDVKNAIFLVQAIHHANEHRGHIATILGANGIEPPELDGWRYATETGRGWIKT